MSKNLGENMGKNLSSKFSQKLLDLVELKSASKRSSWKTAEATRYLIGNEIANKITKISKTSPQNPSEIVESETKIANKRYVSPEKIQKNIDDLRLIWWNNNGISKSKKLVRQYTK